MSRYWSTQNIPALALAFLAWLDLATRDAPQTDVKATQESDPGSSTLAAFGFGGAFFALHCFLSSSTVIVSWVQTGWDTKSPSTSHGVLVLLFMCFGVYLSTRYMDLAKNFLWWSAGAAGLATLYAKDKVRNGLRGCEKLADLRSCDRQWHGFCGGLLVAAFVPSVTPGLVRAALQHNPGRTFTVAWLVYDVLSLLSVFTTAYAFIRT